MVARSESIVAFDHGVAMTYRFIKIFGERNTSTNALKQLIEQNSDSEVIPSVASEIDLRFAAKIRLINAIPKGNLFREYYIDSVFRHAPLKYSWKHTATNFDTVEEFADCFTIINVRHPASWLLALHRRPYHALRSVPKSFERFLSTPWKTLQREGLQQQKMTPANLYNDKIRSYRNFSTRLESIAIEYAFVRFEDFAADQIAVFEQIKPYLVYPSDDPMIVRPGTKDQSQDAAYYKNYYGGEKWRDDLSQAELTLINKAIDWRSLTQFAYDPL